MNPWKNKKCFITGASSGLGLAVLENALNNGAKVSTLVRNQSEQLKSFETKNLHVYQGSVSNAIDVKNWINEGALKFDGIDLLINNAGAMYYMDINTPNHQQMIEMVNTNCLGLIHLIQYALPIIKKSNSPYWINISSDAAISPFPGLAVYSGSKAFIDATTKAMRQELIDKNVKFTNIQPGNIQTPLHQKSTDKKAIDDFATIDNGQYIRVETMVDTINHLIAMPHPVAINELLIEPLEESI